MSKQYQILIQLKNQEPKRWTFVAHGAAYSKAEAEAHCKLVADNSGAKTKIIAI